MPALSFLLRGCVDRLALIVCRLISRRLLEVYNSTGDHLPALRRRSPYSSAFMHRSDMQRMGVRPGEVVRIDSDHAFIYAVAAETRDLLPGVISMAHARGGLSECDGASTNRLVSTDRDFEPISGIPRQSAIPVSVRPLTRAETEQIGEPLATRAGQRPQS